jgi:hypothetical protein
MSTTYLPWSSSNTDQIGIDRTRRSLHHFFHGEIQGGKSATINTQEKSIIAALSLQCNCQFQCSGCWNKAGVCLARITFGQLAKMEQLQRVYDVLLGAQNVTTGELLLAIGGKLF